MVPVDQREARRAPVLCALNLAAPKSVMTPDSYGRRVLPTSEPGALIPVRSRARGHASFLLLHATPVDRFHFVRGPRHCIVLPEAENRPAGLDETLIGVTIPLHVPAQFLNPPLRPHLRTRSMNGAVVPEAAVDEHCQSGTREDDVRPSSRNARQRMIDPEPQPTPMELTPELDLRASVPTPLCRHPRPDHPVYRPLGTELRGRRHILGRRACVRRTHLPARIP